MARANLDWQGHADAQYKFGEMLLNGEGVKKDTKEAMQWLQKAREQGHAFAEEVIAIHNDVLKYKKEK